LILGLSLALSGCDFLDWLFPPKPENKPPVASFSFSPAKPYLGTLVTFDGSASSDPDGQVVAYSWSFGDGSTASSVTASHAYTVAGTYTIVLEVTDDKGLKDTDSRTITVAERPGPSENKPPVASFTFAAQNPQQEGKVSVGDKVVFDASASYDPDGEITVYQWELEPGSVRTGRSVTYTYRKAGNYAVTLTVEDDKGATDSETKYVDVAAIAPKPPVALFTFVPLEPKPGDLISFDASASYDPDGGDIILYQWDFGDGTAGEGKQVTHTYNQAGSYPVTLTVTDDDEPPQAGQYKGEVLILTGQIEVVSQFRSPGPNPRGLAWDGRYLWCADASGEGTLYKIDPSSGSAVSAIPSPGMEPAGLAWDGKYLWNVDRIERKIFQLDSRTGTVVNGQGIDIPGPGPTGLTWDGQYLWVADDETYQLYQVDPSDGSIVKSIPAPGDFPRGLAWDGSRLWNVDIIEGLYRLDPRSGTATAFYELPFEVTTSRLEGMVWGGSYLWIADSMGDKIYKIRL
jgi:PKD repeat protein